MLMLFGLAEGALRVRQYVQYGSAGAGIEKLYTFDKTLGLRIPIAGFSNDRVTIDSKGFRNPEFSTPKPANTVRVAFLGGSTTFSANASNNAATWTHIVIDQLRAKYPKRKFDFINAGVPGYSSSTSIENLRLRVAKHKPDIIIIYHATNDLTHFSRIEAKKVGIDFIPETGRLSWISNYSQLFYLLEKNYSLWDTERHISSGIGKLEVPDERLAEPFRQSLIDLVTEAQNVTDNVVLVTFSIRIRPEQNDAVQIKSAVTSLYYMPYITPKGFIRYFSAYNNAIRDVAAQTGAVLIENENSIPGTEVYFKDSVHFTDKGNQLMAERVSSGLINAGTISSHQ
ncbi:MAG: SGNH/GDSL hydrolase family protein [Rhodospirillaceae bacterium]|nr:SGNH/GDSL hydrolase family protein [Rhodospirillaceae bacterium]